MPQAYWLMLRIGVEVEIIADANQCTKSDMIAWVSYPAYRAFCFVYPRYIYDSGEWRAIDSKAFPNNGSFFVKITGGPNSAEIQSAFGSVVVARVNIDNFIENTQYESSQENSTLYSLAFNPAFTKGYSQVEFKLFSNHSMSADLVQVVDISDSVSFIKPFDKPVYINGDTEDLVCRLILIKNSSGTLFGPFSYAKKDAGAITLAAPSSNDYRIARFKSIRPDSILSIRDEEGIERCKFVPKRTIDEMYANANREGETIDWLPQSELVDIITRAINASDEFSNLSKSQLRSIKTAIRTYSDSNAQLELDNARKERIIEWLSQIDDLVDLPSQIAGKAIDSIPDSRILELVQDERYFPLFKDRIIDNSIIQGSIETERKKLEASLSGIKRECGLAEAERDKALRSAEEARGQLEKVRNDALAQKREELDKLENDIAERKDELGRLRVEYENAIADKKRIEKNVDEIIDGINDEISTSTKILESEILRKVVDAVHGVDLRDADLEPVTEYSTLRADEDSMTDNDIVDLIYDSITQRAGRQITRNDAINMMICLSQGYITTFAGQPGTGKTSLCNILAGTLGLVNEVEGKRFTEINVENGWTSYKDYVGYYNPLAKTYEKSNTSVYDAMRMLSKEPSESSSIPPYVFLLDEANLSPIEHYWAPFLRACDGFEEKGASLSLGGTEIWNLPNRVRFLATVNFDHTTEALSNRFLDRSWVITLDPSFIDSDFERVDIASVFSKEPAFSSKRLFQAFGCNNSDKLDQDNAQLLDDLIRVCRSNSFSISPRSQIMMKRYVATASRLMSLDSKDGQYAPLDYAFSQKVLPQISGPAEVVANLVKELSDKCLKLKTTSNQLNRMKEFGKNSGFYQYFI